MFSNEIDLGRKIQSKVKEILPEKEDLVYRPKELEAKIYRYYCKEDEMLIFTSFLNGKPVEIITALVDVDNGILMPSSISNGVVIKNTDEGYERFDFRFKNRRGYNVTIEEINSYNCSFDTYDRIVTNLLQKNVKTNVVLSTLDKIDPDIKGFAEWRETVNCILL